MLWSILTSDTSWGKGSKKGFFRTLSLTVGGWGSKVLNFLVKNQCHVYMAYLTILSIFFSHENLEDSRSGWGLPVFYIGGIRHSATLPVKVGLSKNMTWF